MTIDAETFRIEGNATYLRFAKESDLEAYYTFLQDPELNRLTGSQQEYTRDGVSNWIKIIKVRNEDRVDLLIILRETDELLGEVVLNEVDQISRSANIRIGIQGTQHRGKGHGTEALLAMLRYGFETMKLHRIHLEVFAFNPRAIRVYEKIGFQHEGVQRDALYWDGKFHDVIMMAMLEEEYRLLHRSRLRT
jgi:RimJ/RimL family protein N-acetyltransferase